MNKFIKSHLADKILIIITIVSTLLFSILIFTLNDSFTLTKVSFLATFYLVFVLFSSMYFNSYDRPSTSRYQPISTKTIVGRSFFRLFLVLSIAFSSVGSYGLYRTTSTLGNLSKNKNFVDFELVTLDEYDYSKVSDIKDKKIGMQVASSAEGYTYPVTEFGKENLFSEEHYQVSNYKDYKESLQALIDKKVDFIILRSINDPEIRALKDSSKVKLKSIKKYHIQVKSSESNKVDLLTEPFTVLLIGSDARNVDITVNGNADTLILATFNPKTKKALLTSIPRDSMIPLTCKNNEKDKITHSGAYGIDCVDSSLENFFGITINYFVKVNFSSLIRIVNALGGVEVDVPFDFTEQNSHGKKDAITVEEGLQTLDGEQALAFARHRHSTARGDIERGQSQQAVIKAIVNKFSKSTSPIVIDQLMQAINGNIQTNVSQDEMLQLAQLGLEIAKDSNSNSRTGSLMIEQTYLETAGAMIQTNYYPTPLSFQIPYQASRDAIVDKINAILNATESPIPSRIKFDIDDRRFSINQHDFGPLMYGY